MLAIFNSLFINFFNFFLQTSLLLLLFPDKAKFSLLKVKLILYPSFKKYV